LSNKKNADLSDAYRVFPFGSVDCPTLNCHAVQGSEEMGKQLNNNTTRTTDQPLIPQGSLWLSVSGKPNPTT
jgi:hypothetical protein